MAAREVLRVYMVQHYQKPSKHLVERFRGIVGGVSKILQKFSNLYNRKVN